jgi:hypothetical protein
MSSNFPDDIHNYDDDPRSPFYEEPELCQECEEPLEIDFDWDDGPTSTSRCNNEYCPENPNFREE